MIGQEVGWNYLTLYSLVFVWCTSNLCVILTWVWRVITKVDILRICLTVNILVMILDQDCVEAGTRHHGSVGVEFWADIKNRTVLIMITISNNAMSHEDSGGWNLSGDTGRVRLASRLVPIEVTWSVSVDGRWLGERPDRRLKTLLKNPFIVIVVLTCRYISCRFRSWNAVWIRFVC